MVLRILRIILLNSGSKVISLIGSQAINEIVNNLPIQSSQTAVENVEQPKKKRGRKKKEQLPRALEKSPEIKPVRRSQRNKK